MGIFVDQLYNSFANLKNDETTILTADTHPLLITSLKVINRGEATMRFYLKLNTETSSTKANIFIFPGEEIKGRTTVDFAGRQEMDNLWILPNTSIHDSLVCFSNGYTQVFDCYIGYMVAKELPIS